MHANSLERYSRVNDDFTEPISSIGMGLSDSGAGQKPLWGICYMMRPQWQRRKVMCLGMAITCWLFTSRGFGQDVSSDTPILQTVEPGTPNTSSPPQAGDVRAFEGGEFVWIPSGNFQMGSPLSPEAIASVYAGGEVHYRDEQAVHTVTFSQGFWLGRHEVTNRQFQEFVDATDYKTDAEKQGTAWIFDLQTCFWQDKLGACWKSPGWRCDAQLPVVCVSWNDAQAYIVWLNSKDIGTFRLPTESEWEYACRAGTKTEFFWGDDGAGGKDYLNAADEGRLPEGGQWRRSFPFDDGYLTVAPVGSYLANPWGLHDMLGNVSEWCADWHGAYSSEPVTDPTGPNTGEFRAVRGGSWDYGPADCRSANRNGSTQDSRNVTTGFRVLREP